MFVGCNHDVPGIAGTSQGSVAVMTDAGDVKDRRSYSGIAVGSKVPLKIRGIPCTRVPRNRPWFV